MFQGDISFEGSMLIMNILMLSTFMSIVLLLAQEDDLVIPILDIIQSLICWGTFYQCVIISACFWCFRYIERMLSTRILVNFLIYNAVTYIPFWGLVIFFKGFKIHFSLLYFIPFSLFIFTIWQLPSIPVSGKLEDKIVLTLTFALLLVITFPYGFVPLITSIFGNILFEIDFFRLQKLVTIDEDIDDIVVPLHETPATDAMENPLANPADDNGVSQESIDNIVAMGFNEGEARNALIQANGNVEEAVNHLLGA